MSSPFVPFAPNRQPQAGDQAFRAKILSQPHQAKPFQPATNQAGTEGAAKAPQAGVEPKMTLHREGDRITRIEIQCPCGQCIELECLY